MELYACVVRDGAEIAEGLMDGVGEVDLWRVCVGCVFDAGEAEHLLDEGLEALGVFECAGQAGAVLLGGAGLEHDDLDGGANDGDGGLELVGGVSDEALLAGEGLSQVLKDRGEGEGEWAELGDALDGRWRRELKAGKRETLGRGGELRYGTKGGAQDEGNDGGGERADEDSGDDVEAGALEGFMQQMGLRRGVEQKDRAPETFATGLVAIDDAEGVTLKYAEGPSGKALIANAIVALAELEEISAIGGVADQTSVGVEDDPAIFGRNAKLVGVDEDVVAGIFGILHGTEQRVGLAAEGDIEGAPTDPLLVEEDGDGEGDRGGDLGEEHDRDDTARDGVGLHGSIPWDKR